jgi:hypothetical protein
MKVWNILLMQKQGEWDMLKMNGEALDWVRAWEGKVQCYSNVFSQPMMKLLGEVKCPVLGMSSEKDILYEFFPRVKEIVSLFWRSGVFRGSVLTIISETRCHDRDCYGRRLGGHEGCRRMLQELGCVFEQAFLEQVFMKYFH